MLLIYSIYKLNQFELTIISEIKILEKRNQFTFLLIGMLISKEIKIITATVQIDFNERTHFHYPWLENEWKMSMSKQDNVTS